MKAVKKPFEVDVWQLDGKRGWIIRPDWVLEAEDTGALFYDPDFDLWRVETLEGTMFAKNGDYLIKGIENEIYPCKKEIFEKTYEIVSDDGVSGIAKRKEDNE